MLVVFSDLYLFAYVGRDGSLKKSVSLLRTGSDCCLLAFLEVGIRYTRLVIYGD